MSHRWMLVLFLALAGCGGGERQAEATPGPNVLEVKKDANVPDRFHVASYGWFRAGVDNNAREILILTDAETGTKYIGVTGVGITEIHDVREGKTTRQKEE